MTDYDTRIEYPQVVLNCREVCYRSGMSGYPNNTDPEYRFSLETLADGGKDRGEVEEWWAGEVDRLDDGWTYDDLLDKLDGGPWMVDGVWHQIALGDSTIDPVYEKLKSIGRQVRSELT